MPNTLRQGHRNRIRKLPPLQRVTNRSRVKSMVRGTIVLVAVAITAPLWLVSRLSKAAGMSDRVFQTGSQLLGLLPGLLGVFLRRGYYVMCLKSYGWDSTIEFQTWLPHPEVSIGSRVYIGACCIVAMCDIGDDVLIGSNVDILDGRYQHGIDDVSIPIQDQPGTCAPVRIGKKAWIGNSCVVMAHVGEESVIGAGSVVVKPIPPKSVAVGNPAIVKKQRQ